MGNKSSSSKGAREREECEYCAASLKAVGTKNTELGHGLITCNRCGIIQLLFDPRDNKDSKDKQRSNSINSNNSNSNSNNNNNVSPLPAPSPSGSSRLSSMSSEDLQNGPPLSEPPPTFIKHVNLIPFQHASLGSLSESELLEKIKPLLNSQMNEMNPISMGTILALEPFTFKVASCFPCRGLLNNNTSIAIIDLANPLSRDRPLSKVHVLPLRSSFGLPSLTPASLFTDAISPYFSSQRRHIFVGETITVKPGIQVKVQACTPNDGVVTEQTEIYTDGAPIIDLQLVNILPIYETLPNNQKAKSCEELAQIYFPNYFNGAFKVVSVHDKIEIDGVQFVIVDAQPAPSGCVTNLCRILSSGNALYSEDVRKQQELNDERLARQLQASLNDESSMGASGSIISPSAGPIIIPGPAIPGAQVEVQGLEPLRLRLQAILAQMPADDPNRAVTQRLYDQMGLLPMALQSSGSRGSRQQAIRAIMMLTALSQMTASASAAGSSQAGTPPHIIASLPTHKFVPRKVISSPSKNAVESGNNNNSSSDSSSANGSAAPAPTCMVCLSEFEADEELRMLPCFHQFHTGCIDEWLGQHVKCPICKHPVTSS